MQGKVGKGWRFRISVGLLCLIILFFLSWLRQQRDLPGRTERGPRRREQAAGTSSTRRRARPDILSGEATPDKVGIVVPASEAWKWQPAFSKALKWMEEWGAPCVLVTPPELDKKILEDVCSGEEVTPEIWPLHKAIAELGTLLLAPAPKPDSDMVEALKSYVSTGGWLVVPDGGSLISSLLDIPEYGARKLNSLRSSYQAPGPGVPSEARCLVAHPVVNGFPCGGWLSAKTLAGAVPPLPRKPKTGLPLVLFRNPTGTGVQVHPVGYGGVVEVSWDVYAGGQIGNRDANEVLHNVLQWLLDKGNWKRALEEPILSVQGKVVATDGTPVPKAFVAGKIFTDWGEPVTEVTTVSAENGSFTLAGYAPSIYAFELSAEDYLQEDRFSMARCEVGREDEPTVIRMRRTVALYGEVYYDGDKNSPAPDFPVRLLPADRDSFVLSQETTTNEDGEFAFKKVGHGRTVLLFAEKNEWAGSKVVELPLEPGEQPVRVELGILPSTEVSGWVIDVEGDIPIPEARVEIEPGFRFGDAFMRLFASRLTREVSTAEDGSFAVLLSPDRWHLSPIAEGYAIWWDEENEESGSASVTVSETGPQDAVVLKMKKLDLVGVQFYGTVYLPSGEPAPGATVVVGRSPVASLWRSTTDSFGRYTTDPIRRSRDEGRKTFAFTVRKGTLAAFHMVELKELNEEVQQDLWLGEGHTISGFVRDANGTPLEGARVFEANQHSGKREGEEVLSAADGSFVLKGSTGYLPGSLAVRAEKVVSRGKGGVKYVGQVWFVVPNIFVGSLEDIEIIVAKTGDISGRVLLHDGTPLRNALVEFKMFYTTGEPWERRQHQPGTIVLLGDEGEFRMRTPQMSRELEGLFRKESGMIYWKEPDRIPPEAGKWDILVHPQTPRSDDGVSLADTVVVAKGVEPGTSDLEIRLPPFSIITGRVIDAWTHEPFEELDFALSTHDDTLPQQRMVAGGRLSLQGGVFRVEGLVPRKYHLLLRSDGYHRRRLLMEIPGGRQKLDLGEIALTPSWKIYGRLIEEGTGRWARAKVKAASETTTTAEGIFVLSLTPMKSVQVQITPEDNSWEEVSLEVEYQGQPRTNLGNIVLKPRPETGER